MLVGATYNVFDGEELLRRSIESIRPHVDHIVVVYQLVSNQGQDCRPTLLALLRELESFKLIDELIEYSPKQSFSLSEKRALMSRRSNTNVRSVPDHFFNELLQREVGRKACFDANCTHFMSLDVDEFYLSQDLQYAKTFMAENSQYEAFACRMRTFFKFPTCELLPKDSVNHVNVLYQMSAEFPFRFDCQYPVVMDPTRKLENLKRIHVDNRVEMYHYSYVRHNIRLKLENLSNRSSLTEDIEEFMTDWDNWKPGQAIIHPHPEFKVSTKTKTGC